MIVLAVAAFACGSGQSGTQTPPLPTAVTVENQTPCVLHIRFDNSNPPIARIKPGERQEIVDSNLASYGYMKAESTMAIFRTYPMDAVRANGSLVVIKPDLGDHPCFEQP